MANGIIIGDAKNKIIKEFIKDDQIVCAIGAEGITSTRNAEKLIGTHIFNYNQNPNTINTVGTFVTVQVQIPKAYGLNYAYVEPAIEIWIFSHESHMVVDNISKINRNRNDYLSELIDKKLSGRTDFGVGELLLESNIETSLQKDYLCRQMIFRCKDFRKSMCEDE